MEHLLLHIFLVILPVYLFQMFMYSRFEINWERGKVYMRGAVYGLSAALCALFPFYIYPDNIAWDMRSIPMAMSFLYGGPIAGIITISFGTITQFFLANEAVFVIILGHFIYVVPLVALAKFNRKLTRRKRFTMLIFYMLLGLVIRELIKFVYFNTHHLNDFYPTDYMITAAALTGFIIIVGLSTVMLKEIINESYSYRKLVQQSEKLLIVSDMAASVAHEVRNPLMVTRGFLQLAKPKSNDQVKYYIDTALVELDRAASIITEYLSFAKPHIEAVSDIDLNKELLIMKNTMLPYANLHGAVIEFMIEEEMIIRSDLSKLKQIIMNIIKNAIEATKDGSNLITIHVNRQGSKIIVRIQDQGGGMSHEVVKRLGTPFFTTKATGTGLGLLVTHRLVQEINGRIKFESAEGVGTSVTLKLGEIK